VFTDIIVNKKQSA